MESSRRSHEDLALEIECLERDLERLRQRKAESGLSEDPAGNLDTVSVPEAIVPIFLRAQEYVRRYFSDRVENPAESTISISGERYILLRAASMSVEFFDLVTSLYRDRGVEEARSVANNILFDLAHAIGKADARAFAAKMNVTDPIERLSAGPIHFSFSGWAYVNISPESNPVPSEDYFLIYDHPFSFESDSWLSKGKRSEGPVCIMNSGYSSGWCEESFGLPLVAAEIECLAAGDERCRFIMAPPSRIEERLGHLDKEERVGKPHEAAVSVPEFFQRKRMEDDLRRARDQLEIRVGERTNELVRSNALLQNEINDRKAVEEQLRLLESAVQSTAEGICILSPEIGVDGPRILFANAGFSRLTGLSFEAVIGRSLEVLNVDEEDRSILEVLRAHLSEGRAFRGEAVARRTSEEGWVFELHVMPIFDASRRLTHWVASIRDVTERKEQLARLEHQALHDDLTGLPNRALLLDRLDHGVSSAERGDLTLALLVLDLDRFKEVNDTFGHQFGDAILVQVSARLREILRASDTIARLGGDEFAVLLPSVSGVESAVRMAEKLIQALEKAFVVEDQMFDVGASIGIALYPEHGTNGDTLMRRADVAMYLAKQSNLGFAVYSEEHDRYLPTSLALMGELRRATERHQFELYYQPKVSLRDGTIRRVEALVRWNHPTRGLLLPEEFIPMAERTGVTRSLTPWVLESALSQCRAWRDTGYPIKVAVNLSARCLQQPTLPDDITELLEKFDLETSDLKLEITENSIMVDPDHVIGILIRLGRMGVRLSIDDFGTGYSSLSHIRVLPVDEIKIDKSFIRYMTVNERDARIVESLIRLSHSLDRKVVAEGVEDEATWSVLRELGCDLAQGFFVSAPLPSGGFESWYREEVVDGKWRKAVEIGK